MRIVSVHTAAEWGGAERYTRDLLSGLAERGHDVVSVTKPGSPLAGALAETRVEVVQFDLGLPVGWHGRLGWLNHPLNWIDLYANPLRSSFERLLQSLEGRRRIDVLHAQHVKEKLWVTAYGIRRGIPVAWTVHAPLEPWMTASAPGRVHSWARARVDGLLAVSQATLEDYERFGYAPRLAEVIYNGVDIERYARGDRGSARRRLGVEEDVVVLLVVARPYPGKGIDLLLDALKLGSERGPSLTGRVLVIVAGASSHIPRYQAHARQSGIGGIVTFLGHRDDIPDLLAASDAVVLPSLFEGLPYAISEAMCAGRPVIAARVGGIPEMVEHGRSGLLVDKGSPDQLWAAIESIVVSAETRSLMGARGQEIAAERFGMQSMLDKSERFFEQVSAFRGR